MSLTCCCIHCTVPPGPCGLAIMWLGRCWPTALPCWINPSGVDTIHHEYTNTCMRQWILTIVNWKVDSSNCLGRTNLAVVGGKEVFVSVICPSIRHVGLAPAFVNVREFAHPNESIAAVDLVDWQPIEAYMKAKKRTNMNKNERKTTKMNNERKKITIKNQVL